MNYKFISKKHKLEKCNSAYIFRLTLTIQVCGMHISADTRVLTVLNRLEGPRSRLPQTVLSNSTLCRRWQKQALP
jgi:hypothetical protein